MHVIDSPELAGYQWDFVRSIDNLIRNSYFCKRPRIRILDAGCDRTGRQLWHLASLTSGEIVGINVEDGFPSPEASKLLLTKPNATLRKMDAMNLQFPDESFDMVISANVLEHIRAIRAALR